MTIAININDFSLNLRLDETRQDKHGPMNEAAQLTCSLKIPNIIFSFSPIKNAAMSMHLPGNVELKFIGKVVILVNSQTFTITPAIPLKI